MQHANVTQPGYLCIYLSNENDEVVDVFFDDLTITHHHGPIIQQDDYYPFGLTFNSYSRENSVRNRIKFQGQEHIDDLGLGWDSFKWRNHQPDIGRFFNVDPLAEKYVYKSPYAFSENHVVAHRELEGLEKVPVNYDGYEDMLNRAATNTTTINRTGSSIQVSSLDAGGSVVNSTQISLPSKNTQGEITDKSAKVIGEIAMTAGESSIGVSRVKTDAQGQARAMFNNLVGSGKGQGLNNQKALYSGKPGTEVISTFVQGKALQRIAAQFGGSVSNGQIKNMMASTVDQIGLANVTNHAQENPSLNVIDVAPSTVSQNNQASFTNAASSHPDVKRIIPPPRDPAFHIEIRQN